jgi:hypothetical protein
MIEGLLTANRLMQFQLYMAPMTRTDSPGFVGALPHRPTLDYSCDDFGHALSDLCAAGLLPIEGDTPDRAP